MTRYSPETRYSVTQVTMAVMTPLVYLGLSVHSWGDPMHPAQYPMKNMVLTVARFVFPLMLEAERDRRTDMTALAQDA